MPAFVGRSSLKIEVGRTTEDTSFIQYKDSLPMNSGRIAPELLFILRTDDFISQH